MDAGIGQDTNHFWLFGGTGNFSNLGGVQTGMDNILHDKLMCQGLNSN